MQCFIYSIHLFPSISLHCHIWLSFLFKAAFQLKGQSNLQMYNIAMRQIGMFFVLLVYVNNPYPTLIEYDSSSSTRAFCLVVTVFPVLERRYGSAFSHEISEQANVGAATEDAPPLAVLIR